MSDNDQNIGKNEPDLASIKNVDTDLPPRHPGGPLRDISLDDLLSEEIKKDDPEFQRKKRQIILGGIGIVIIIILLSIYSFQPRKGPMGYAICSAFLEQNTTYPHTLNYTALEGSVTAIRIYFTNLNAYGSFKEEMIECGFASDEKMGMKLAQVTRNRRPVDQALVDQFNISLPAIIASDPYRAMPPEWKNPLLRNEPPMHRTQQLSPYILQYR